VVARQRASLEFLDTLHVLDCCVCHITFAMIDSFRAARLRDHQTFYCPAGHTQKFTGPSDEERARARVVELERQLASRQDDLRAEQAKHAATKATLTKTKTRAERGVCLHCHRSFANVARHTATRHPEAAS
jgi:hypothetical protein